MVTYKEAGVDMNRGDDFVEAIRPLVEKTERPEVIGHLGGFAGFFRMPKGYKDPVLVASTDGVGTKIELAKQTGLWKGIGQDCVAMCVNDLICCGAEPLFFLDYLASSHLDTKVLKEIVAGMAAACQEVGCSLLGGETAEMPGVYAEGSTDVAGFSVGVVERNQIIDGKMIAPGDILVGVASSGFHSNGFSLIRRILADRKVNLTIRCAETNRSWAETLLTPTHLYPPLIQKLKKGVALKGIAHITGGGLEANVERVLPAGRRLAIDYGAWPIPDFMLQIKKWGEVSDAEFYQIFNAGIGFVVIVSERETEKTIDQIGSFGYRPYRIGVVV